MKYPAGPFEIQEKNVARILLIVFVTSTIAGIVMIFYDFATYLSLFLLAGVCLGGWILNRAGHRRLSAVILIVSLFVAVQFNILWGFGLHDVAIVAWPALIVFCGLIFGSRAIYPALIVVAGVSVMAKLVPNAEGFSRPTDTGDMVAMLLILTAFTVIISSIFKARESAVRNIQQTEERFEAIYNSVDDAIIIHDAITGGIVDINERMRELFGYTGTQLMRLGLSAVCSGVPPYTPEAGLALIRKAAAQGPQECEWQARDASGRVFWVDLNMRAATIGGETQVLVTVRDISERRKAEEIIQASLREKIVLLQEIHHRVKNNMQVISSLLNLQAGQIQDEICRSVLKDAQTRIRSLSLIHEWLYKGGNLSHIDFGGYIDRLAAHLIGVYQRHLGSVRLETDFRPIVLDIATAAPCGLLLNELISNALKHAFPDNRPGLLRITMRGLPDGVIEIRVADDGIGLPENIDFRESRTYGFQIVSLLLEQLEGNLEIERNGGTAFLLTFRELKYPVRM